MSFLASFFFLARYSCPLVFCFFFPFFLLFLSTIVSSGPVFQRDGDLWRWTRAWRRAANAICGPPSWHGGKGGRTGRAGKLRPPPRRERLPSSFSFLSLSPLFLRRMRAAVARPALKATTCAAVRGRTARSAKSYRDPGLSACAWTVVVAPPPPTPHPHLPPRGE